MRKWDGAGERGGDACGRDGRARRKRLTALDPGEQRDDEERHEVEEVALLDALRIAGREESNLGYEPDGERDRRCRIDPQSPIEVARVRHEHDDRRERKNEDREVELRDMER